MEDFLDHLDLISEIMLLDSNEELTPAYRAAHVFVGRLIGQYLINNAYCEGTVYSLDGTACSLVEELKPVNSDSDPIISKA